jgi:excisionase family DNA binding protein
MIVTIYANFVNYSNLFVYAGDMTRLTITVEEAAQQLGVHPESLRRAIRKGRFPAVRIGRRTLIAQAVLNNLLSGECVGGAS